MSDDGRWTRGAEVRVWKSQGRGEKGKGKGEEPTGVDGIAGQGKNEDGAAD